MPTWLEAPITVLRSLQSYVDQPARDLDAELASLASRRDTALSRARAAMAGYPRPAIAAFEDALAAAQLATVLSEDHKLLDRLQDHLSPAPALPGLWATASPRASCSPPSDVFFLTRDELQSLRPRTPVQAIVRSIESRVHARRAERAAFARGAPPRFLRTPSAQPALPALDDALSRAGAESHRHGARPPADARTRRAPARSAGSPAPPASRGAGRGSSRRWRRSPRCNPTRSWSRGPCCPPGRPSCHRRRDRDRHTGGMLSHAAAVAREYGIPAVVGTQVGTLRITSGQLIEVNGDTGVVHLVQ